MAPLGAALVLLVQSCSGPRSLPPPESVALRPTVPTLEAWVDAAAPVGGDGSAGKPWRTLPEALGGGVAHRRVHLAAGLYPGPFSLPDGTELVGGSAAVLTAPAGVRVVTAGGAVSLSQLLVQGGTVGLYATGALRLSDVRFSGQRQGALALAAGGTLEARGVVFEASVSGALGLVLEADTVATLSGCTFEGPWQRAIEAHAPASLQVQKTGFRGAVTALHQRGGRVDLQDVHISEGRGPGLYVVDGVLGLHRVAVAGHEYALLTGSGAVVEGEDVTSTGADRAGVGLVKAKAHLQRLSILSAGTFGGLQCVAAEASLEGLLVDGAQGVGVSARDCTLRLVDAAVHRTRDADGSGADGVQVRGGRAILLRLGVEDVSGACLLAAEGAEVSVSTATLEHCRTAGVAAETGGHLSAEAVTVHASEGPGAVATQDGLLVLRGFRALATDGVVWAECASGAQVRTADVAGVLPALSCVQPLDVLPVPGLP